MPTQFVFPLLLLLALPLQSLMAAPSGNPFNELPELFQPKEDRSERDQDHVQALAKLTYARFLEQRGQHAEALQEFQRAYRLTPGTSGILRDILRLESRLKRPSEGTRYMMLLSDLPDNQLGVSQCVSLAAIAIRQGELERAAHVLDQAAQRLEKSNQVAELLGVHMRLMEVQESLKHPKQAAEHAAIVRDLLKDAKTNGLQKTFESFTDKNLQATYVLLGNLFLAAKRYQESEAMYRKANEYVEVEGVLDVQLAELALLSEDRKDARKHLNAYFQKNSATAGQKPYELFRRLTTLDVKNKNAAKEKVIARLQKLYESRPENHELGYFLANLYVQQKKWGQATKIVHTHLKDHKAASANQILVMAAFQQQNQDDLLTALQDSLSSQFNLMFIEDQVQQILEEPAKFQLLIDHAETKLAAGEGVNSHAAIAIARIFEKQKDYDSSWKWIQRGVAANQDKMQHRVLMTWALDMFQLDQFELAEQALKKAVKYKIPKQQSSLLFFYLATIQQFQDKSEEALQSAKKAISLEDSSALLQSRVPWIYYQQNELDQSKRHYKRLLAQFGNDRTSDQTRGVIKEAKSVLSNIATKQKQHEVAEEWLEQILDEYPEDVGTHNDLGYLWIDQNKNLQRGLRMIQKAVDAEPENMAYRDSLGWAYYRIEDYQNAEKQIKKAIELADMPDAVILDHLAEVYKKQKRSKEAEQTWQKAIQLYQSEDEDEAIREIEEKIKELQSKE